MNLLWNAQNLLSNTVMMNITFEQAKEYLPFLIPIVIIEFALAITALVHVLRHKNYRFGNTVIWAVVVLLIQFVGPIVYFAFGKGEE